MKEGLLLILLFKGKVTFIQTFFLVLVHVHCRDFNIFSSHGLLPSDLVAESVERRRCNPKVVGSIPTLVRVFLCPCVGPFPLVGLTLTWFIWDRNLALHITLYSDNSSYLKTLFALIRPGFEPEAFRTKVECTLH